ncbi:MAG: hypothetical protein U1E58_10065 [Tabrizicola sp.]
MLKSHMAFRPFVAANLPRVGAGIKRLRKKQSAFALWFSKVFRLRVDAD